MMSMMTRGGGNSMPAPWGMGTFSWVFMILFCGLIILGIVTLVNWIARQNITHVQDKPALETFSMCSVRGKIDKKEFEEKKKDVK